VKGGGQRSLAPLNKIWLARHDKRFTIEEIIKIVAIRCQILRLKCTKAFVGWGSAPGPLGELIALPKPLISWILGAYFKGEGKGREGRLRDGKGGGEGTGSAPKLKLAPPQNYFPGAGAVRSCTSKTAKKSPSRYIL